MPEPTPAPLPEPPELAVLIKELSTIHKAEPVTAETIEERVERRIRYANTLAAMRKHFRSNKALANWCGEHMGIYRENFPELLRLAKLPKEEALRRLLFDYRWEKE
jgi:hypothetical protein